MRDENGIPEGNAMVGCINGLLISAVMWAGIWMLVRNHL